MMLMDFAVFVLRLSLYAIPLYLANSLACVSGGKTRIDLGTRWADGKELFGKGKTIKGVFFGTLFGFLGAFLLFVVFPAETTILMGNYLLLGFLLALGAVLGDLVGSFLKRRLNVEQGKEVLFLDQFDFLVGGLVLSSLVVVPSLEEVVALFIVTFVAHKIGNVVGYFAKIKSVPW